MNLNYEYAEILDCKHKIIGYTYFRQYAVVFLTFAFEIKKYKFKVSLIFTGPKSNITTKWFEWQSNWAQIISSGCSAGLLSLFALSGSSRSLFVFLNIKANQSDLDGKGYPTN